MANKSSNDTKMTDKKANEQIKQKSGLNQKETTNLSQEGASHSDPNKAGILPGQQINEETPSPLADSIEAEKLAQYKKAKEDEENA